MQVLLTPPFPCSSIHEHPKIHALPSPTCGRLLEKVGTYIFYPDSMVNQSCTNPDGLLYAWLVRKTRFFILTCRNHSASAHLKALTADGIEIGFDADTLLPWHGQAISTYVHLYTYAVAFQSHALNAGISQSEPYSQGSPEVTTNLHSAVGDTFLSLAAQLQWTWLQVLVKGPCLKTSLFQATTRRRQT